MNDRKEVKTDEEVDLFVDRNGLNGQLSYL